MVLGAQGVKPVEDLANDYFGDLVNLGSHLQKMVGTFSFDEGLTTRALYLDQ